MRAMTPRAHSLPRPPPGALAGCYESARFKSKAKPLKLGAITLLGLGGADAAAGLAAGSSLAAGNLLTR